MLRMSTAWQWSSPACATSGIDLRLLIMLAFLACSLSFSAHAATIQAGIDIQVAIDGARPGDTVLVGPGEYTSFEVDRPLQIQGRGGPVLHAAIQQPAIIISSDRVSLSGFNIKGVKKDTTAKFNYYMQNPAAAAGQRLDQPNAAIVVRGSDVSLQDSIIFGAQVGVQAENAENLSLKNMTLESCDSGASLSRCRSSRVEGCIFSNCNKFGLDAEECDEIALQNNSVVKTTSTGFLVKGSERCIIQDNLFSGNTFGLSLWRASFNEVRGNRAEHNYYGILVTDSSNNNTIADNVANENSRSEIVKGFGEGISLQENSSFNLVIRNTARKNFNGLEVSRGCKYNAVYGNTASDNSHGLRMNENRNNLIFGNNFQNNNINAYENISLNIWNTTTGNYYSDYHGKDDNGDGIGDQPYSLPGPESKSLDYRPLVRQQRSASLDEATLKEEVRRYARYGPADNEIPVFRRQGGTIVIASRVPSAPPRWGDSKPLDVTVPPN